ncbi:MAG: 16S rRNA (cytidine(1402)-2'-O)-methyltransferase, partial [Oscillospiraceae bacterium]
LVLEGCAEVADVPVTEEDALAQVSVLRGQGFSLKDAVRQVSLSAGLPKNQLYDLAVAQNSQ